jgi:serum/glucocorticoid-regulated kinase 2
MGCTNIKLKYNLNKFYDPKILSYYNFYNFKLIGKGRYGPIYLCKCLSLPKNSNECVMIQYIKSKVILSNSLFSILKELNFLKNYNKYHNPFLVNLLYAFQDKTSFYLIEEYYSGGDLRYHITNKKLTESKSKFLISNLILGIEFLNKNGFVHRNIKPENLLLDSKGYLHINDFKLLREAYKTNYFDNSGTKGYMAPEIIFRQNHGMISDIFSIGIILYEMMFKKLNFDCKDKNMYKKSLFEKKDFLIKISDLPEGWSIDSADFINKCIQKRAFYRIGYYDIEELKQHRWFENFKWNEIKKKQKIAPFIPKKVNYDIRERLDEEENLSLEGNNIGINDNISEYIEYCEITGKFDGYYYDYKNEENEIIDESEINSTKNNTLISIKKNSFELNETKGENNNQKNKEKKEIIFENTEKNEFFNKKKTLNNISSEDNNEINSNSNILNENNNDEILKINTLKNKK